MSRTSKTNGGVVGEATDTRQRLIEAAAHLFADRGYHHTSIREICASAGTNIAAVNYHFGDKLTLYKAAFDFAHDCERFELPTTEISDAVHAEVRLRQYIRGHIDFIVLHGRDALLGRMLSRELAEPSEVIPYITKKAVLPRVKLLRGIIRDLLEDGVDEALVRNIHLSIVSQCIFFQQHQPFLAHIYPDLKYDAHLAEELVDHITRFSLAGIAAMRQRMEKDNS